MLSKSDFQLASSCPKKLVYKKKGYLTANDTDEYMEMLAKGGYIIGTMATYLFPTGIEIKGDTKESLKITKEYLAQDQCILFEAAIEIEGKIIRIDILQKDGNKIHLIEVKAKSNDTEEDVSVQKKKLEKYIEDVAYQYLVIKEAYPNFEVKCSLLTPDKSKRTTIDGFASWFTIEKDINSDLELEETPAQLKPKFNKPKVVFKYESDPNRSDYVNQIINEGILNYADVTDQVLSIQPIIKNRADLYLRILDLGIQEGDFKINKVCKKCEFKIESDINNGYKECWGTLADSDPHIFDLFYGGSIGHHKKGFYLDELIDKGKTNLFAIDPERLKNSKGILSTRGERQLLQINNTKTNTEWISPDLSSIIKKYQYPLHFIDFETYTGAIPFHKGMRPYELIAFQWSCHTINYPGATPIHSEWIHTESEFPNFQFAASLMKQIGYEGTPFMWATHENTVLRMILNQMEIFEYSNEPLRQWILNTTHDSDLNRVGRLIDMNDLTKKYYFHPYMKGRTSIKKVLPAIWNYNPYLHTVPHFSNYSVKDLEGGNIDPYDTLTFGAECSEDDEVVKGGTAAMRAYQRIRFDDSLSIDQKNEIKRQLLEYCKLDTMAMVIIAYHWGLK